MAGTIFNIFGDHLTNPVHKQLSRVTEGAKENSGVGKGALSLTPARKPLGSYCTPQANNQKKTFLQNRGALSVGKPCNNNINKNVNKNFLKIYEDNSNAEPELKLTEEDIVNPEYNRKPIIDDDEDYLSDSDVVISEQNIDNMIFDIPNARDICLPQFKQLSMLDTSTDDKNDFNDILQEDNIEYLNLDLDLPEID